MMVMSWSLSVLQWCALAAWGRYEFIRRYCLISATMQFTEAPRPQAIVA